MLLKSFLKLITLLSLSVPNETFPVCPRRTTDALRLTPVSRFSTLHALPPAKMFHYFSQCELVHSKSSVKLSALKSSSEPADNSRPIALAALSFTPFLWGTYGVAMKTLFSVPNSPPELLFNVFAAAVSASTLTTTSLIFKNSRSQSKSDSTENNFVQFAGFELGGYLFFASTLQIFALHYTSISRVAFLTQLTTVFAPLLSAITLRRFPSSNSLISCGLAFIGVLLLSFSNGVSSLQASMLSTSSKMFVGDILSLGAALIYTLHVVRLGVHAPRHEPLALATAKEQARFLFSIATLIAAVSLPQSLVPGLSPVVALTQFVASSSWALALPVALIALWQGGVVTALPTYLQSLGQRNISSSTAAVIYASQPLWSTMFAFILFGERLGAYGAAGGAVVLGAILLASKST